MSFIWKGEQSFRCVDCARIATWLQNKKIPKKKTNNRKKYTGHCPGPSLLPSQDCLNVVLLFLIIISSWDHGDHHPHHHYSLSSRKGYSQKTKKSTVVDVAAKKTSCPFQSFFFLHHNFIIINPIPLHIYHCIVLDRRWTVSCLSESPSFSSLLHSMIPISKWKSTHMYTNQLIGSRKVHILLF